MAAVSGSNRQPATETSFYIVLRQNRPVKFALYFKAVETIDRAAITLVFDRAVEPFEEMYKSRILKKMVTAPEQSSNKPFRYEMVWGNSSQNEEAAFENPTFPIVRIANVVICLETLSGCNMACVAAIAKLCKTAFPKMIPQASAFTIIGKDRVFDARMKFANPDGEFLPLAELSDTTPTRVT